MQRRRATFLLAFEQDRDIDRKIAGFLDIGAGSLHEGHQLALVVRRTARDDDLAAVFPGLDDRIEGIAVPELQRVDRLDIIMAIEQHMRSRLAGLAMANDHRVAGGVAHGGLDPDAGQLAGQPVRGFTAGRLEGGVSGNAFDLEKVEQALEALVEIGIDACQDLVDGTHDGSLRIGTE